MIHKYVANTIKLDFLMMLQMVVPIVLINQ